MRTWVKLYTEILDDPDIGSLSWEQRGVFTALLSLAGKLDHRDDDDMETGRLDTLERVAWHLRCGCDELREAVAAFTERGFIDEQGGILYLTHYAARQAHSPSESRGAVAERVKRHRAQDSSACNEGVTPLHAQRNEDVTHLDKIRIEENRKDKSAATPPNSPSTAKARAAERAHEIDDKALPYVDAYLSGAACAKTSLAKLKVTILQNLASLPDPHDFAACVAWKRTNPAFQPFTPANGFEMVFNDYATWVRKGKPKTWTNGNGHGAQPRASPERVDAAGRTYNEHQAAIIKGDVPDGTEWHPVEAGP